MFLLLCPLHIQGKQLSTSGSTYNLSLYGLPLLVSFALSRTTTSLRHLHLREQEIVRIYDVPTSRETQTVALP
jgi:hypothetical protein